MRKNIKYVVWGGIRFFERREIKDALCYLRLVVNQDDLSFRRVVNTPSRLFGTVSMEKLEQIAVDENLSLFEALKKHQDAPFIIKPVEMSEFVRLVEECKSYIGEKPVLDILDMVLRKSGYIDLLRKDEDLDRLDNLNELLLSVKYYQDTHEEYIKDVDAYLQDIALYTNMDFKKEDASVKLMTIHQSKGLEFPFVFVCGLSEGIIPSARTIRERKEDGLEEERRLMYVAVTRAEKRLFLSESEGFSYIVGGEKFPSRFIREIEKDLCVIEGAFDETLFKGTDNFIQEIEQGQRRDSVNQNNEFVWFDVGDNVKHHVLGVGTILEVDKEKRLYVVDFNGRKRTIRSSYQFSKESSSENNIHSGIGTILEDNPHDNNKLCRNEPNQGNKQSKTIPVFSFGEKHDDKNSLTVMSPSDLTASPLFNAELTCHTQDNDKNINLEEIIGQKIDNLSKISQEMEKMLEGLNERIHKQVKNNQEMKCVYDENEKQLQFVKEEIQRLRDDSKD